MGKDLSDRHQTDELSSHGRSRIVGEVRSMRPEVRSALGIDDFISALIDSIITLSSIVIEESEEPLVERLSASAPEFAILNQTPEWISVGLESIYKADIEQWVNRIQNHSVQSFLKKSLGTASYDRLKQAFNEDSRVLLTALQIGTVFIRPWTLALDDTLQTLNSSQLIEANLPTHSVTSFASVFTGISKWLDLSLEHENIRFPRPTEVDRESIINELEVASEQMRQVVQSDATNVLDDLNVTFARKIQGARDALEYSADGISQAANSLVELIDRFAREAFTQEEVLDWVNANSLAKNRFTYIPANGGESSLPTKNAMLLCLAWGGGPINPDPNQLSIQRICASCLTNLRTELQGLKHSDSGDASELDRIRVILRTIEGAVSIMIRGGWSSLDRSLIDDIRTKVEMH